MWDPCGRIPVAGERHFPNAADAVVVVSRDEEAKRERAGLLPTGNIVRRERRPETLVEELAEGRRYGRPVARPVVVELGHELVHQSGDRPAADGRLAVG